MLCCDLAVPGHFLQNLYLPFSCLSSREIELLVALAGANQLDLPPKFTNNCHATSFRVQISCIRVTQQAKQESSDTKFEIQRKTKGLLETLKKKKIKQLSFLPVAFNCR